MAKTYRDLLAWQRALDLLAAVNPILDRLPARERNRLHPQLGRAALSIALNIAEGQGRKTPKEFSHFLGIGRGSLREVEACFDIIERLSYLSNADLNPARVLARRTSYLIYQLDQAILNPKPQPTPEQNGAKGAVVEPLNLGGASRRRRTPSKKSSN